MEHRENRTPSKRLRVLEDRLTGLFNLLTHWHKYTEIVYMPESMTTMMRLTEMQGIDVTSVDGDQAAQRDKAS